MGFLIILIITVAVVMGALLLVGIITFFFTVPKQLERIADALEVDD